MSDYISRDDAKKVLCEWCNMISECEPCEPCDCVGLELLGAVPSVEICRLMCPDSSCFTKIVTDSVVNMRGEEE